MGYGISVGSWGAGLSGFSEGLQSGFFMGDRLKRRKQDELDRKADRERQAKLDTMLETEFNEGMADRATARERSATEWKWKEEDRANRAAMTAEIAKARAEMPEVQTPMAARSDMPRGIDAPGVDAEKGAQVAADSDGAAAKPAAKPATDPRDIFANNIRDADLIIPIAAKYGDQELVNTAMRAKAAYADMYQSALDRTERAAALRKDAQQKFALAHDEAMLKTLDSVERGDQAAVEFYNFFAPSDDLMLASVEPTGNGFKITRQGGKSFELPKEAVEQLRQKVNGKGKQAGLDPETVFKANRDTIADLQKQLAEGTLPPTQAAEAKVRISELEAENEALREGKKVQRDPQARGLAIDEALAAEEDKAKAEFDTLAADDWLDNNPPTVRAKGRLTEVQAERAARAAAQKRKAGEPVPKPAEKAGQGGTGAQGAAKQAAPAAGAMVKMKDPTTGQVRTVRAEYVEMAKSKGLVLAE